jgi:hypothetical protein
MRSHADAIADTGDGYTLHRQAGVPRLWLIQCLWCDWDTLDPDRATAIIRYRAHESEMLANEQRQAEAARASRSLVGAR